ncbi:MAG TPA: methylamine utilization protein MauJ, partial [Humidesulfovibrio sp.]|uniref:methylamine utilization protein MauJ n=1 Tax=Humidesulfovibrio sp. TaxID=2910988 RepID=UPI002C696493
QTCWPTEKRLVHFCGHDLLLMPETDTTHSSVHIDVSKISRGDAYTLTNRLLSVLAFSCESPARIDYGHTTMLINEPIAIRKVGRGVRYPLFKDDLLIRSAEPNQENEVALSFYREALLSDSYSHRFLCFYKIINLWHSDRLSGEKGNINRPLIKCILRRIEGDQRDDIKKCVRELGGFVALPDLFYKDCRCAIAHANEVGSTLDSDFHQRKLFYAVHIFHAVARDLMIEKGISQCLWRDSGPEGASV